MYKIKTQFFFLKKKSHRMREARIMRLVTDEAFLTKWFLLQK